MGDLHIIPAEGVYADDRGRIVSLPAFPAVGAMIIDSCTGAVRGNHYHRGESHLMYVISGRMLYIEQEESGAVTALDVTSGESVITPPGVPHCTVFLEDTTFIALSDADRSGGKYEEEVVRVRPLHEHPGLIGRLPPLEKLVTARHAPTEFGPKRPAHPATGLEGR